MAILTHNNLPGFVCTRPTLPTLVSMAGVGTNNPLSSRFVIPGYLLEKPTPYSLSMWLVGAQGQHGNGKDERPARHLRQAKALLASGSPVELIARATWWCGQISRNPFSFKFVQEKLPEFQVLWGGRTAGGTSCGSSE